MQTEYQINATPATKTDWPAVRGEIGIYILAAVFTGLIVVGLQIVNLLQDSISAMGRVEQRMNADSRIIQIAIEQVDPERKPEIEAIEREYAPH